MTGFTTDDLYNSVVDMSLLKRSFSYFVLRPASEM